MNPNITPKPKKEEENKPEQEEKPGEEKPDEEKPNEKEPETEDIFDAKTLILKIVLLLLFLIAIFVSEIYFRKPLFDLSLNLISDLQNNVTTDKDKPSGVIKFFKIVTYFGTTPVTIPFLVLFYLFTPFHATYRYLLVFSLSSYLTNILKLIYQNPRPFWEVGDPTKIYPYSCSGGFGNPSGHSFTVTSTYLTAWWGLCKFCTPLKGKIYLHVFLFIFFFGLSFIVMFSRMILGVHSLNQLLFGILLGIALFLLFHYVINIEKLDGKTFFGFFSNKISVIIHTIFFICFIALLILLYVFHKTNLTKYEIVMKRLCPTKETYQKFNNHSFHNSLAIFTLIGGYYGVVSLFHLLNNYYNDDFNNEDEFLLWYEVEVKEFFIKVAIFILVVGIVLIPYIFVPTKVNVMIIFVFKIGIPFLISIFLMFGPVIYFCLRAKAVKSTLLLESGNKEKLEDDGTNKDLKEKKGAIELNHQLVNNLEIPLDGSGNGLNSPINILIQNNNNNIPIQEQSIQNNNFIERAHNNSDTPTFRLELYDMDSNIHNNMKKNKKT